MPGTDPTPVPARHPNWGRLPDIRTLHRLYLDKNLSMTEIAERYGVRKNSVYLKLKRHAAHTGQPWPLKTSRADWLAQRGRKHSEVRWDAVKTLLLVGEVREACMTYRCSQTELTEYAGLSLSVVSDMMRGTKPRVSRRTAERLMAAIEALETGALVPDPKRWAKARRKWPEALSTAVDEAC